MLEIFQYGFMVRAFAAGTMIGIIAPLIGTFLVIRRYSRLADTLAHVSLAGVAVGLLTRTDPVVSAIVISVSTAFCVEKLRFRKGIFGESVLALFLWSGMAVAVVIISIARGFNVGLFSFLFGFGSITTIAPSDLYFVGILGALVLLLVIICYKELFIVSFDEELAQVNGIKAKSFNMFLVILAAVTVSLSMRVVGILLIGALMVIPVITAMQFSRSFKQTLIVSVVISLCSVVAGLFLSYYFDLASGGTIVLVAMV
jgi:zinc transport system permease protein